MEHNADALPELDLDEPQEEPLSLDLDAAEEPLFKLPITVHGKKVRRPLGLRHARARTGSRAAKG